MGIPIGQTSTATLEASVPKYEHCIYCNIDYVYIMSRKAAGSGSSLLFLDNEGAEIRAENRAAAALSKKFEKETDPVRCPSCGKIQPKMLSQLRLRRATSTLFAGLAISFIAGIVALFLAADDSRMSVGAAVGGCAAFCSVLLALGWYALFDPNDGRNYLKAIPSEMADGGVEAGEYEALMEQQEAAERQREAERAAEQQQRRAAYEERQAELRGKAQARKEAEMKKMAERAKRSLDQG